MTATSGKYLGLNVAFSLLRYCTGLANKHAPGKVASLHGFHGSRGANAVVSVNVFFSVSAAFWEENKEVSHMTAFVSADSAGA